MILSIQMYSLRKDVERDGLDTVLAKVKASGFDGVELAGTYGLPAVQLRKQLDDQGLTVTGAHVGWNLLTDSVTGCVETAAALGYTDIICPGVWAERTDPTLLDKMQATAMQMPAGYRFGYHNHMHEFEGGDFLRELYEKAPGVWFEPDTFWLRAAGKDVIAYCNTLRPRIMALHLKELSAQGKDDFNPVPGDGVTGCADVVRLARELGHEYIVLEAENLNMPFDEYLRRTAEFVKNV